VRIVVYADGIAAMEEGKSEGIALRGLDVEGARIEKDGAGVVVTVTLRASSAAVRPWLSGPPATEDPPEDEPPF
jgi:hypothetical protein